jgi:hypothetical protein
MNTKILKGVALMACFIFCITFPPDLSGKWNGEMKGPQGRKYAVTYIFKINNNSLSGSFEDDTETMDISEGRANGDDLNFSTVNQQGGMLVHTGKYLTGGDSISMNIIMDGKKLHTTLYRQPN